MFNKKLSCLFLLLLACFLHDKVVRCDSVDDDDDEDSPEQTSKVDEKPVTESETFQPENFTPPDPPQNAYFYEFFKDENFRGRWILSQAKKEGIDEDIAKYNGEWTVSLPETVVLQNDYVLVALSKARHHAISSKLLRQFSFKSGKPLIVQYDVNFQHDLDCGGAYIKLLSNENLNLNNFNDKTPYTIMFGPDKCGLTSKLHFIIRFKNPKTGVVTEHHAKQPDKLPDGIFTDKKSHVYTLALYPDSSYEIYVDQSKIASGNLLDKVEPAIMPPKEIDDPDDRKPSDWDDREKIPDPNAKKPDDWDEDAPEMIQDPDAKIPDDWLVDEPEYVPDEKAVKPSDWDEEMDGKWEAPLVKNTKCEKISGCGNWTAPMIKNKNYKGKWKPPMINNPAYQGKWAPRKIANPDYFEINSPFEALSAIGAIGLELWTMSDGIAFDNFLLVDDKSVADKFAAETWSVKLAAEKRGVGKSSIFGTLIQTANEKPWLWAVYLLVILIPIVLVTIFCFSGGSKDDVGRAKKTDKSQPDVKDHEHPEGGASATGNGEVDLQTAESIDDDAVGADMTEEREASVKTGSTKSKTGTARKSVESSPKKPTKADLDEISDNDESEPDDDKSGVSEKNSNSPRRRAARKE